MYKKQHWKRTWHSSMNTNQQDAQSSCEIITRILFMLSVYIHIARWCTGVTIWKWHSSFALPLVREAVSRTKLGELWKYTNKLEQMSGLFYRNKQTKSDQNFQFSSVWIIYFIHIAATVTAPTSHTNYKHTHTHTRRWFKAKKLKRVCLSVYIRKAIIKKWCQIKIILFWEIKKQVDTHTGWCTKMSYHWLYI